MTIPLGSNGLPSPWTEERIALLKKLWADGYVTSFIAVQLGGGITKNSVIGKALRLGLPNRKKQPQRGRVARNARSRPERAEPASPTWKPFLGIELLDLERGHCRFPKGDGPFLFCGQPSATGSGYCDGHHAICYGRSPVERIFTRRAA